MSGLIAPLFSFGDTTYVPNTDSHIRLSAPKGQLALTGPSVRAPAGQLPVRGDLAHIALAGTYFVPHYAEPMAHSCKAGGASLRATPDSDADEIGALVAGAAFAVLDISGDWAWGQAGGESGLVGYIALSQLEHTGS